MYALANVQKFLQDNKDSIGTTKVDTILKRARAHGGSDGVLVGGSIGDIFRDPVLAERFAQTVSNDVEHQNIGVAALKRA